MKTRYFCEKCGTSFDTLEECINHEESCTYISNDERIDMINQALDKIIEEYKIDIIELNKPEYIEEELGGRLDFELYGKLSNDIGIIIDASCLNHTEKIIEDYYNTFKNIIIEMQKTEYEGIIEHGWGADVYLIGDKFISNIMDKFIGKKVRIELI